MFFGLKIKKRQNNTAGTDQNSTAIHSIMELSFCLNSQDSIYADKENREGR